MMNNKKGAAEELLEQVPYIILTIIVMAGIFFLLSYYSSTVIDVSPVQANVFLYRLVYAPNTLSYTDPLTGRVYPGVINESEFTSEKLDLAIKYDYERQIMARLEMVDDTGSTLATAYYNKVWYERLEPVARARLTGASSAKIYTKDVPVIYRKGGVDIPATMKVTLIMPE